jgi:DNA polymerase III subunit beta
MKFTSSIKPLSEAVSNAVLSLPPKATDFRYEAITLSLDKKKLSLFATDGDLDFTTSIEVDSTTEATVVLNAKKLQDILRNMYDAVAEFKTEKKEGEGEVSFAIKTDRGSYKMAGTTTKGDTSERQIDFDIELTLAAEELKKIAERVLFAVSTDNMRPAMTGVLVELDTKSFRAVSTDGWRLVRLTKKMDIGIKDTKKIIIPSRILNIVQKTLPPEGNVTISIATKAQKIQFILGETKIIGSLIAENYPNYDAVIPLENDKTMLINRQNIAGTVKRVARFSSRGDIRFEVSKDVLKVSAENTDEGSAAEETLVCDFKQDDLTIGFNSKFVEEVLSHLDTEEVTFDFSSATRAAIIKPKTDDASQGEVLMLVMPVRINT